MTTIAHLTDLHLDRYPKNLDAALAQIENRSLNLILVGGDNGGREGIERTISALSERFPDAAIAWTMGNHDLWKHPYDAVFEGHSTERATYLEHRNLELDFATVVGTYGHYDYSGGTETLTFNDYESFTDGRHIWNDHLIDRRGRTNPEIAQELADGFKARYARAIDRKLPIICLTHTLPFVDPLPDDKRSFVTAYIFNSLIGDVIKRSEMKPAVLFCGHSHRPRTWAELGFPVINTGSDYTEVRTTVWSFNSC